MRHGDLGGSATTSEYADAISRELDALDST
jgi:hypothetical protein